MAFDQTQYYSQHLKNIHYWPSTPLNTIDIHLPADPVTTDVTRYWIIYIHGGAWRDPLVTSTAVLPALNHLSPFSYPIAGVASINYRLSPYKSHPTDPSTPTDGARNVKHPTHITDVLTAITWLQKKYGFGQRYMLVGHSCGATLALQAVMRQWSANTSAEGSSTDHTALPVAIVGLEGIYNLQLLRDTYREYPIYQELLEGAFGADEEVWQKASPIHGEFAKAWENGKVSIIAHSKDDEKVDMLQAESMLRALKRQERRGRKDRFVELKGKHDEIWQGGRELARAIEVAFSLLDDDSKDGQEFSQSRS